MMTWLSSLRSVASTWTTASAPGGIGAPVVIRTAVPGVTSGAVTCPAIWAPMISRHGEPSSAWTAKPSMIAAGNGGWSAAATRSAASVRPTAVASPTASVGSGPA